MLVTDVLPWSAAANALAPSTPIRFSANNDRMRRELVISAQRNPAALKRTTKFDICDRVIGNLGWKRDDREKKQRARRSVGAKIQQKRKKSAPTDRANR